jgi:hypothetical protein
MQIVFNKEKISFSQKVSPLLLRDIMTNIGTVNDDFTKDLLTVQVEAFIIARLNEVQTITVHRKPQRFIDWILRRHQTFTIEIKCREVMKNPPLLGPGLSVKLFELKEIN